MKIFGVFLCALVFSACSQSYRIARIDDLEIHSFRRDYSNVHLVKLASESYLMIDSGSWEEAPLLADDMRQRGIQPSWVKAIVLTHGHWDHASGAKYFQEQFSVPIIAGRGDQRILKAGHSDPLCSTSLIARLLASGNERKQFESPKITTWVDHETNLSGLIGVPGSIVLIPTHTEGSLVIIMGHVAFIGDLVRGSMISSAAATHFYLCDVEANRQAVRSFLEKEGRGVQIFFPGHFGPTISRDAMVDHFKTKDDQ